MDVAIVGEGAKFWDLVVYLSAEDPCNPNVLGLISSALSSSLCAYDGVSMGLHLEEY